MIQKDRLFIAVFSFVCLLFTVAGSAATAAIDIPFEKFVLDNGLTVLIHEDHKAPIIAVGVWYHVGSKDEPSGRTGFAHLFEHLMFEGSEHYDAPFFTPLEQVGASSLNGSTWLDRTNFFENVPTPALELALWLESDRMGHLLTAVNQEKLDQERGVVENEKRESDNQPYGNVVYHLLRGLFPPGHPYHHPPIGSMQDLKAATVEDVHSWFKTYYGAANAVLVLAGDIEPGQGKALAEKYFGDIPPGPPVTRLRSWIPERQNDTLEVVYDRVPQARSYRVWAIPGWVRKDRLLLQLAANILGGGKNSRLYQSLVNELQYAVNVSVEVEPFELASLFSIDTTLTGGVSIDQVNAVIDQELNLFLRDGPGEDELNRARTGIRASIIRGLERVGGFNGKATTLAQGELYDGNPDFYKTALSWIDNAQSDEIRDAARRWLARGVYQLDVLPFPEYQASGLPVDRSSGLPAVTGLPEIRLPPVQRARLSNGMVVVLAERTAVPVISVALQFDAGFAADAHIKSGTAGLTLAMLEESTTSRSAVEIGMATETLGAEVSTSSELDTSTAALSALKQNLEPSISLFAEMIRSPAFVASELERLQVRWLAGIEQEKSDPLSLALRTLPPLIYGTGHVYGIPFTGSGTERSIAEITRDDLVAFHQDWIRPDNAILFVVGDTTLGEIAPLLEASFGDWAIPESPVPAKEIAVVSLPGKSRIILIDKPGAQQSMIMAAHVAPPTGVDDNIEILMMNDIIGGTSSARVNQNLRADNQWSYGAFTFLRDARGQRPWIVYAPVQSDRTADSINQLLNEFRRFTSDEPPTNEELTRVSRNRAFSLPAQYETSAAVMEALQDNESFGRPDDYVTMLKSEYQAASLEEIQRIAQQVIHPDRMTWVIVGDRALIEERIRALGIADLEFMDTSGRLIE